MHLVNKPIAFRIDSRFARYELAQQRRPSGSVNSGESRDDTAMDEDEVLRFKQGSTRLARRFGLTLFGDPRSISLRIDTGAACKNDYRSNKSIEKIACAI